MTQCVMYRRDMRLIFAVLLAFVAFEASTRRQEVITSHPIERVADGVEVLERREAAIDGPKRFISLREPIWTVDEFGFPVVSPAGYLEVVAKSPYSYRVERQRRKVDSRPTTPSMHWGDIASFAALQRAAMRWMERHPGSPGFGIGDVSSPLGGFPDLDGDGRSDHLTHQTGTNFDIAFPQESGPPKRIAFGREGTEHYRLDLAREFVTLLIEEGAGGFTTTSATRLLESVEGVPNLPWEFGRVDAASNDYAAMYAAEGLRAVIILLSKAVDHGAHFNVELSYLP